MATIQYVGVGAFNSGTTSVVPVLPTGLVVGDFLLLLCESANETITAPTGWTEIGAQASQATGTANAAGGVRLAVFYRYYTAGLGNPTCGTTTNHITAQIMALRNVNKRNPFSNSTSGVLATANTAVTLPAVSTTAPNSMIVLCLANDRDATNSNSFAATPTNANLTTITERMDDTAVTGAGGGVACWTAYKATVGSTGTTSATNAASVTAAYLSLALRPSRRICCFL